MHQFTIFILLLAFASCAEQSEVKMRGSVGSESQAKESQPDGHSQTISELEGPIALEPPESVKPTLMIILPADSMRLDGTTMQVKSKLSTQEEEPEVRYEISSAIQKPLGAIDAKGLYTSPKDGAEEYTITFTSIWLKDESVRASANLKLVPVGQIFIACVQNSVTFPITADVFTLKPGTAALPDFAAIASDKVATVCLDQYNVPVREFTSGFPGFTKVFEWFALRTKTLLVIPTKGLYTFRLNSDDGSKLYLNKALLIDNDGNHPPRALDASIELEAGVHELALDYFQGPRFLIALELSWKVPGEAAFVIVPKSAFK